MKDWVKFMIPTALIAAVAGARVGILIHQRHEEANAVVAPKRPHLSGDQLAVDRQLYIFTFDAAQQLVGKPVWIRAGYMLKEYPFRAGRVVFPSVGLLAPAEKLDVVKIVRQAVPAKEDNRVPHGSRQGFVVFTRANDTAQYAAPIGVEMGGNEQYFADDFFFYDDPHGIYDNWSKDTWAAIDKRTPQVGMSERQVRMAVGQVMASDSKDTGDRTVEYTTPKIIWTVTFVNDKATSVAQKPAA